MGKTQILLSYPAKDKEWARDFERSLKARGIDVWQDRHVGPGDNWVETLEKALEESAAVAFLLDLENTNSPWLLFEWGAALARNKKVILILSEDLDLSQLPALLKDRAHLRKDSPDKAAEEVVNTLRAA